MTLARAGAHAGGRAKPTRAASPCDCPTPAPARTVPPVPADDAASDAVFKALASAPRRQLLRIIAANTSEDSCCAPTDVCACNLADALELAPSTISHHMSVLVAAGLVTAEKRGLWVYYGLNRDVLARAAGELALL